MKRMIAAVAVLAALAVPVTASAQQATPSPSASAPQAAVSPAGCQYILGFKTLHDMDPNDIGTCLDNQVYAGNGDAQQHTTKGLLAWRKSDNWTAFTNGYMTWINGPNGLVNRLNTDRFPWEHDQPAATATASPAPSSSTTTSLAAEADTNSGGASPTQPITALFAIVPALPARLGPFTNTASHITGNCTGTASDIFCTGSDGSKLEQISASDGTLIIDGVGPNGNFHLKQDPAGNAEELSVDGAHLVNY